MMKRQLLILFALLSLAVIFTTCEKDLLMGEYDQFEGKYQWSYSSNTYRDWFLGSVKINIDSASEASYTAQIEFDNTSHVTFFIDNVILIEKRFRIKDQSKEGTRLCMDLHVDVSKQQLDIDDRLEVCSISEDTILVRGFPGLGYDNEIPEGNYFVRIE